MKAGDHVAIQSANELYMKQWREKADCTIGTIQHVLDMGDIGYEPWYDVQFPNGYENNYPENDLELISHSFLSAAEYDDIMEAQILYEGIGK